MRLLVAVLAGLALGACDRSGEPSRTGPQGSGAALPPASVHERGRKIYNFRCYYCHGYSGDARTLAATYLTPPPRDFTRADQRDLTREAMVGAIAGGRAGTAMQSFASVLSPAEIGSVADFVRAEFMVAKAANTRYHTPENGWPEHERYRAAFPFARGDVALDTPDDELPELLRAGKRLFMETCVSCHDRAHVASPGAVWETRPLSFPRNGFAPAMAGAGAPQPAFDAWSGASPYALHDRPPAVTGLSARERRGEALYQQNCAFCHAADGTGRNWIGSFLEPHPRDLTSAEAMRTMSKERLAATIAKGLPGTSMPAWEGVLERDGIDAVVAYVARAFHPLAR